MQDGRGHQPADEGSAGADHRVLDRVGDQEDEGEVERGQLADLALAREAKGSEDEHVDDERRRTMTAISCGVAQSSCMAASSRRIPIVAARVELACATKGGAHGRGEDLPRGAHDARRGAAQARCRGR